MRSFHLSKQLGIGIFVLVVVLLMGSFSLAASNQSSIGSIDMERIQNEIPDFLRLAEVLKEKQQEFNLYRGYIYQQAQNAIKALQDKATQEKTGKSAEEQANIDKRLQDEAKKKNDEVNNQLEQKSSEFQKYLNDQKKGTLDKLKKTIADVAADKKLSAVFEKGSMLYGGEDITQAVIDKAKKEAATASKTSAKSETKTTAK